MALPPERLLRVVGDVAHSCGPGACELGVRCPAAHSGGPTRELARAIKSLTLITDDGRAYYRELLYAGWRRLRTAEDYARLNAVIDLER